MIVWTQNVWNQVKNLTCVEIISALQKDGWAQDTSSGAVLVFRSSSTGGRVTIHYHPKKTYGAKLLKGLFSDIGWSEDDLRRLRLIR